MATLGPFGGFSFDAKRGGGRRVLICIIFDGEEEEWEAFGDGRNG